MPKPHVAVLEPVDEPGRVYVRIEADHYMNADAVDELIRRLVAAKHKARMAQTATDRRDAS